MTEKICDLAKAYIRQYPEALKNPFIIRGCADLYEKTGDAALCRAAVSGAEEFCRSGGEASALGRGLLFAAANGAKTGKGPEEIFRVLTRQGLNAALTAENACGAVPFAAAWDVISGGRRFASETAAWFGALNAHLFHDQKRPSLRETGLYLTGLTLTLTGMDEQLYEHYRKMIDLFREEAPRALDEAEKDNNTAGRAAVAGAVLRAVLLGIADGETDGVRAQALLKQAVSPLAEAGFSSPEEAGLCLSAAALTGGGQ